MNKKLNIFYLILSVLWFCTATAQPKLVKQIDIVATNFTVDYLGNIYFVKGDEVVKYNNQHEYFNRFSNKSLGKINFIDATNPLKVLVLYNDVSVIQFLDNMLGKSTGDIFLQELGMGPATLACTSFNNGFWVYNPVNFELRRLDETLNQTVQTFNLNQITGVDIHPDFMVEHHNWLYLNNPETGILVFDIYGTYNKQIPLKGLNYFQVVENAIYYQQENSLYKFDTNTLNIDKLDLPEKSRKVIVLKNLLYTLSDTGLSIYSL